MSLSEQLKKDIVAAMKGKEEMRLSVLRMAKAALQLKEVEKMRPLDDRIDPVAADAGEAAQGID